MEGSRRHRVGRHLGSAALDAQRSAQLVDFRFEPVRPVLGLQPLLRRFVQVQMDTPIPGDGKICSRRALRLSRVPENVVTCLNAFMYTCVLQGSDLCKFVHLLIECCLEGVILLLYLDSVLHFLLGVRMSCSKPKRTQLQTACSIQHGFLTCFPQYDPSCKTIALAIG